MTADPTLTDDLAHLRAMAEAGRNAPLLNGPVLVAASLIFGAASLLQWAIQSGLWQTEPMTQLWVWVAASVVFAATLFALIRQASHKPGFGSYANHAVGVAWSGLGFGIFVMWLSFLAVGFVSDNWTLMWAMPSLVATTYGTAWVICGGLARARWMNVVGLVAYAGAVLCGALIGRVEIYLVFAALLVATALVPGLILMRGEPRAAV